MSPHAQCIALSAHARGPLWHLLCSWLMDVLITSLLAFLVCIFVYYLFKQSFDGRRQSQPDPTTTVILQPPHDQAQDSLDAGPGHLQPDAQPATTEDNEVLR